MKFKLFKKEDSYFLELAEIIFRFSLLIFVVLFVIEYILPGFVTNWFNPIWFLIVAIISGTIVVTKD